jgi:hypothetical protein
MVLGLFMDFGLLLTGRMKMVVTRVLVFGTGTPYFGRIFSFS